MRALLDVRTLDFIHQFCVQAWFAFQMRRTVTVYAEVAHFALLVFGVLAVSAGRPDLTKKQKKTSNFNYDILR